MICLAMYIDGASADHLPQLAKEANATFLARGHATRDPQGKVHCEPSRCVFLYRLP